MPYKSAKYAQPPQIKYGGSPTKVVASKKGPVHMMPSGKMMPGMSHGGVKSAKQGRNYQLKGLFCNIVYG